MTYVIDLRTAHTADLDGATRAEVRQLLDDAFDGDFGESDWEHCLGGVHVLVREGGSLVGHGAVVQRRLLHGGRALRAGYVGRRPSPPPACAARPTTTARCWCCPSACRSTSTAS